MPATATPRPPRAQRPRQQRYVRLEPADPFGNPATLTILVGNAATVYELSTHDGDGGDHLHLETLAGGTDEKDRVKELFLDWDGVSCTCKGYERWRRCKHSEAVAKLRSLRLL